MARKQINVDIGARIRKEREKQKVPREELAGRCGISPYFEADLERGNVGASLSTIKRLCEELHISSDYVLWGDEEKRSVSECFAYVDDNYKELLLDILQKEIELIHSVERQTSLGHTSLESAMSNSEMDTN
ncbi:MAG: helix-turn-helix transcriptional regulator [Oscillibacter sp.]|nr:helix-turn-helix transcriptional regulator [Oscillibacter sp.]